MSPAQQLRALSRIMQEFRVIEPDLPASYASVILFVATYQEENGEDPSVGQISSNLGMTRPSASRAAAALSDRRLGGTRATKSAPREGKQALGVLERYKDATDGRKMRCRFTQKGKGLIARLKDHLQG